MSSIYAGKIDPVSMQKILEGSQKVFSSCKVSNKLGMAFYASHPKIRYPWIYIRDFSAIIVGLSFLGDLETARECCKFLLNIQSQDGQWHQKYDSEGNIQNIEHTHPIIQEDNTPLSLYSLLTYIKEAEDKKFKKEAEESIVKAVNWIKKYHEKSFNKFGLVYSTTSIHQTPGYNEGYELWHNSLVAKVFALFGEIYGNKESKEINGIIKEGIAKYLVSKNRFIRRIDKNGNPDFIADIIMISPSYFNIFGNGEKINKISYEEVLTNSLNFLDKELWDEEVGGFARYPNLFYKEKHPEYAGNITDPLLPGPYMVATSIIGQAYCSIGEKNKALDILNWLACRGTDGQFPEHLTTKERYGKYKIKEIEYMKKHKKDSLYLKGVESNFLRMEEEARNSEILSYVLPLAWSQIEVLKLLKLTGFINKFKITS